MSRTTSRQSRAKGKISHLGYAKVDLDRVRRQGYPEVIFAASKTPAQVLGIAKALWKAHRFVLATRCNEDHVAALKTEFPDLKWNATGKVIQIGHYKGCPKPKGYVIVVSAGTGDLPIAEEAIATLTAFGINVERVDDSGVAGLHRILSEDTRLRKARAIIVVAGMEGALPSVVAGLVPVPVIAVPTSVGYGAALGGFAALLGMLTSCGSGVTVVNIDNGFGAAFAAARIMNE